MTNFHHTDLKKMIELMAQVERDLKAGRYQNALRQRQVLLDGLGNVKQYLEGEFQVRQDATTNLPADIQKEILGSMQDPSPAGWEELNRQYFERLSGGREKRRREGKDECEMKMRRMRGEKCDAKCARIDATWPDSLRAFCILHLPFFILHLLVILHSLPSAVGRRRRERSSFRSTSSRSSTTAATARCIGDMLWKKLSRERRFIIPESMLDVRDYCTSHHLKPSPDMDLEKMRKIVQGDFDAQIGIWGSVERAPGAGGKSTIW